MRDPVLDISELTELSRTLMGVAARQYPKESKTFLQKEGNKLKNLTRKKARQKKIKKTGNYLKSIKRGKMYKFSGDPSIRVYSSAPHAHLIEKGHRMVTKSGREVGFVRGHNIFEKCAEEYTNQFTENCEDFLVDLFESGME